MSKAARKAKEPEDFHEYATPYTKKLVGIIGGQRFEGNILSASEISDLRNLYGTEPSDNPLIADGNLRDTIRQARHDGLRLMAFLSKFLHRDEDPVKLVARTMSDYGFDVSGDILDWADWVEGVDEE